MAAFGVGDYDLAAQAFAAGPAEGVAERWLYLAAAEALRGEHGAARAAAAELRRQMPDFDLDWYLEGYPWEPGLHARLSKGAALAFADQRGG